MGGGLSFEFSNPDIDANYFFDNYSAIGGCLCCLRAAKGNSVANNLFESNAALFFGGGVAFLEAHTLFVNNTIVNNYSSYGGGIFVNAAAMPKLNNCIIWSNMTKQIGDRVWVWVYDIYSASEFYYNNIQGGF